MDKFKQNKFQEQTLKAMIIKVLRNVTVMFDFSHVNSICYIFPEEHVFLLHLI